MFILLDTGGINLKLEKYNENVSMVSEWLTDNEDIGSEMAFVLNAQLAKEVTSEKEATRHWSAIKSILGLCPNPPIARRGANCPYRQHIDSVEGLKEALLNLYDVAGHITFKHGKSGGGTFDNPDDYLDFMVTRYVNSMKREAKEGRFSL